MFVDELVAVVANMNDHIRMIRDQGQSQSLLPKDQAK